MLRNAGAADSVQNMSLNRQHHQTHQEKDFGTQTHSQEEQERCWDPRSRQPVLWGHHIQGGLILAQRVGGTAGVLLAWLNIPQLAHGVVERGRTLGYCTNWETLQQVNCVEPLDFGQWGTLDVTHGSEARLFTALHQQSQNLWRSCRQEVLSHVTLWWQIKIKQLILTDRK